MSLLITYEKQRTHLKQIKHIAMHRMPLPLALTDVPTVIALSKEIELLIPPHGRILARYFDDQRLV